MKHLRATVAAFGIAAALVVLASAFYCFPGCALWDKWDIEYWIFSCFDCPPPSPEG